MLQGLTSYRRCVLGLALAGLSMAAGAQNFPAKPITVLDGFPPGFYDVLLRHLTPIMSQELGQPVVVDYKTGAGGSLAVDAVTKAAADGYLLVLAEHSSAVYMHLLRKLPFDPYKDLAIVSSVIRAPFLLVGGPTLKVTTLRELIAEAKANPGKISYGHSGNGTMHHLAMEMFQKRAGINLLGVPFKGGAPSRTAVVAGTVDLSITGEDATKALVAAGKVKALGPTSESRMISLPNLPTMGEILPGYTAYSAASVFAHAATPRPIMARLNAALLKALRDPEASRKVAGMGVEPEPRSLEDSDRYWRKEGEIWAEVIRSANIRLDE